MREARLKCVDLDQGMLQETPMLVTGELNSAVAGALELAAKTLREAWRHTLGEWSFDKVITKRLENLRPLKARQNASFTRGPVMTCSTSTGAKRQRQSPVPKTVV